MIRYFTQQLVLHGDVWCCAGCGAWLTNGTLTHPEDCPQIALLLQSGASKGEGRGRAARED